MTGFDLSTITGCYVGSTPATAIYYGSSKIWPVSQHDYSQDYLTIVSLEDNNDIYFEAQSLKAQGFVYLTIEVSNDEGNTWSQYTCTHGNFTGNTPCPYDHGTLIATLNTGDKILIKGNNSQYSQHYYAENILTSAKTINVEGNIMSLIYGDNFATQLTFPANSSANFASLFYAAPIVSAENLILPVTTLVQGCYYWLFYNCTSIIKSPKLPATTLATLCCARMFEGCTALTAAPELPATTLAEDCYGYMFYGCSSLNYIKCLATDISATNCLAYWVDGVAASGTFVKDANTTWPTGVSGIPSSWTVVDAA